MFSLELKVPPLLLTALFVLATYLLSSWPWFTLMAPETARLSGIVIGLLGVIVMVIGALQFRLQKTTLNPLTPDASTLVTSGIYRITRNPMYLGMLLLLTGVAVTLNGATALLLLPVFVVYMNRYQIAPEERFLLHKFGQPYQDFMRSTRRWL